METCEWGLSTRRLGATWEARGSPVARRGGDSCGGVRRLSRVREAPLHHPISSPEPLSLSVLCLGANLGLYGGGGPAGGAGVCTVEELSGRRAFSLLFPCLFLFLLLAPPFPFLFRCLLHLRSYNPPAAVSACRSGSGLVFSAFTPPCFMLFLSLLLSIDHRPGIAGARWFSLKCEISVFGEINILNLCIHLSIYSLPTLVPLRAPRGLGSVPEAR